MRYIRRTDRVMRTAARYFDSSKTPLAIGRGNI
jgi:hypothetical protein